MVSIAATAFVIELTDDFLNSCTAVPRFVISFEKPLILDAPIAADNFDTASAKSTILFVCDDVGTDFLRASIPELKSPILLMSIMRRLPDNTLTALAIDFMFFTAFSVPFEPNVMVKVSMFGIFFLLSLYHRL